MSHCSLVGRLTSTSETVSAIDIAFWQHSSKPAEQLAVGETLRPVQFWGAARTGAALAGQARHDGVQLLPEAHVQQPVRLVQHQHLRVDS